MEEIKNEIVSFKHEDNYQIPSVFKETSSDESVSGPDYDI